MASEINSKTRDSWKTIAMEMLKYYDEFPQNKDKPVPFWWVMNKVDRRGGEYETNDTINFLVYETARTYDEYGCLLPTSQHTIITSMFEKSNIDHIEIPGWIHEIYPKAFYNCKYLHWIYIPEGVTYLGTLICGQCPALTDVYFECSEEKGKKLFTQNNIWTNLEYLMGVNKSPDIKQRIRLHWNVPYTRLPEHRHWVGLDEWSMTEAYQPSILGYPSKKQIKKKNKDRELPWTATLGDPKKGIDDFNHMSDISGKNVGFSGTGAAGSAGAGTGEGSL